MIKEAGFSPALRLRKTHEFAAARRSGKKLQSPHFVVYAARTGGGPPRLGLTVSRKVGGAVERNRVKRLLREFFRRQQHNLNTAADFSIIAKPGAALLSSAEVHAELAPLLTSSRRAVT